MTKKVGIESGARNKVRGRPFEPGNKLGRGRPKGSRNKTKPGQDLWDEYAPHLIGKCITEAMHGKQTAMRLCMERSSPARRGACIRINLPAIKTAADVDKAAEKVTQATRRGVLTPAEGDTWMNILESRSRVIERVQWENRLEAMEARLAAAGLLRAA
jgi:hypothetical protein